jgi:hypothetical protein
LTGKLTNPRFKDLICYQKYAVSDIDLLLATLKATGKSIREFKNEYKTSVQNLMGKPLFGDLGL